MAVYDATDVANMFQTEVCRIDLQRRGQFTIFRPIPGREYQVQVSTYTPKPVTFRWTVTNAPVFRLQPLSQTVSKGASTIFSSLAVGVPPLNYQWRQEGTNIPYATNQMISFDNIDLQDQGEYCVQVTSSTGTSTSQVAQLTVTTNDTVPRLVVDGLAGSNTLWFSVVGETGRRYRMEFSSDLKAWQSTWHESAIFNTNQAARFLFSGSEAAKFLRVSPLHAANEVCANHIRQLRTIIWMCAEERHMFDWDFVGDGFHGQLDGYLIHGIWPMCPSSGKVYTGTLDYTLVDVTWIPVCQIAPFGHVLEDR